MVVAHIFHNPITDLDKIVMAESAHEAKEILVRKLNSEDPEEEYYIRIYDGTEEIWSKNGLDAEPIWYWVEWKGITHSSVFDID